MLIRKSYEGIQIPKVLEAASLCEREGTLESIIAAKSVIHCMLFFNIWERYQFVGPYSQFKLKSIIWGLEDDTARLYDNIVDRDFYLELLAKIALDALIEMGSPGVALLKDIV